MIHVIRVATTEDHDPHGEALLHDVRSTLGISSITSIRTAKVFRLEGLNDREARAFTSDVLCEPINQFSQQDDPVFLRSDDGVPKVVEVAYKPGVMNPEAASLLKAARDLGFDRLVAADSSIEYAFYGAPSDDEIREILDELYREEERLSYRRRILHGKIDILRAELVARLKSRRESGESIITARDVDKLSDILASTFSGSCMRSLASLISVP